MMEPKPNQNDRTSMSNSTEIKELFDRVVEFLANAPSILVYGWNSYRRPVVNLAIVIASLSAILVIFDVVGSVNQLIFLPTLFTVLGIIQAARFGYRNVLFAKDRQKLLQQVRSVKQELIGSASVTRLLEADNAIEVQAIVVEEPLTLESIVPQEEALLPVEEPISPVMDSPIPEVATVPEEPVTETTSHEDLEPAVVKAENPEVETVVEPETIAEIESSESELEPVAETIEVAEETVTVEAENPEVETVVEPETIAEIESLESELEPVAETIEVAEETVTVEAENPEVETVVEGEPENIISESTPSQPEALEKEATTTKDSSGTTTVDSSKSPVEKTPAKFLGFEKKIPKKSKKKSIAKTETLAPETTNPDKKNLTADGSEMESSKPENLETIASQSLSFDDILLATNGVDELRYLFIGSQVELLGSPEKLEGVTYSQTSETLGIGVVKAEGEKCDRCWNYSTSVGKSIEHPTICDRCVAALNGKF
jgi:CAAD domains of cyanobacterial aminoacyl-tRNA synthetase/Zinc finger found in FPG and IleRS